MPSHWLRPATLVLAASVGFAGATPAVATGVGAARAAPTHAAAAPAADTTPPDVTAPLASPRIDDGVGSASVPFAVSWAGTDASGIARWTLQRQVDGGSWETMTLGSATATSAVVDLRPPHEYAFRVRATDTLDNTSAYATSAMFRVRRLGETTTGLSTTGPWQLRENPGYLGGQALGSGVTGATATFAFTGSQVAWIATRAANRGRAEIAIDGVPVTTVDLAHGTTQYRRLVFGHVWPSSAAHSMRITVVGTAGHPYVDVDGLVVVDPPAVDPVLVGAGDVATCGLTGDSRTAALLDDIAGRVFAAGDLAYPDGTSGQFRDCFGPTWGRWKARTSPAPGNHEYHSEGAAPYYAYFGARAGSTGAGWYAYDLGTWRVYVLNSNCTKVGCGASSPQVTWLRADLAANPRTCVAAVWHHPRFSSGEHGNNPAVAELWRALEEEGAEVVLTGHDHDYERFAPQTGDRVADPAGIRQFVVGTGGAALRSFGSRKLNSVVRSSSTYGVLKLTLRAGSYDWRFVPAAGGTFTDSGSGACH